jgi:drug/metabolite transporter (DMT)-like permease
MNQQIKGSLFIAASATGSATLAIFIKLAFAAGANIVTILSVRFILAALFLLAALRVRHVSPRLPKRLGVQLCLMGIIGYGGMSVLFAHSLHYLSASLTGMLLYSYPAMVTLLSFVLGDEPFNGGKLLALFVCLSGLFLVLGVSAVSAHWAGVVSILGAAIIYSIYIVIGNRLLKRVEPFLATTYVCASTGLAVLMYGMVDGSLVWQLPTMGWLAILGITLLPTLVGIGGFFVGLELIGATNASIICTLEPLITTLLAAVFLGEMLTALQMSGGLLILAGVVILQLPRLKK